MALFSAFLMSHQGWEYEYPYSIYRHLIPMLDLLSVGCEYVYANTSINELLDHAHHIGSVLNFVSSDT